MSQQNQSFYAMERAHGPIKHPHPEFMENVAGPQESEWTSLETAIERACQED